MAYNKTIWQDLPNETTPVNASNLNKIEDELEALDTGKQDKLTAGTNIQLSGNTISANDIYSSNENKIGIWSDGKPLYRRTFNIPATDILQNSSTIINLLSMSTIKPKMIYGIIGFQTSNVYYPIIGAANRDSVGYGIRWFNSKDLQIIIDKIMYPERKVIGGNLVIEYTKTTD